MIINIFINCSGYQSPLLTLLFQGTSKMAKEWASLCISGNFLTSICSSMVLWYRGTRGKSEAQNVQIKKDPGTPLQTPLIFQMKKLEPRERRSMCSEGMSSRARGQRAPTAGLSPQTLCTTVWTRSLGLGLKSGRDKQKIYKKPLPELILVFPASPCPMPPKDSI